MFNTLLYPLRFALKGFTPFGGTSVAPLVRCLQLQQQLRCCSPPGMNGGQSSCPILYPPEGVRQSKTKGQRKALCCPILYPLRFCPFGATCTPEGGKAHRAKAKRTGGGTAKRRQRLSSLVVRFALPLRFASPLGKRRNKRQRKQRPKETNGKGNGSCPPMVLPFRFAPRRGQQLCCCFALCPL